MKISPIIRIKSITQTRNKPSLVRPRVTEALTETMYYRLTVLQAISLLREGPPESQLLYRVLLEVW